ncbi:MAG: TonB family protein [Bacteroidota bacterium]
MRTFLFLLLSLCTITSSSAQGKLRDRLEPGSKLLRKTRHTTLEKTPQGLYLHKRYHPQPRKLTHLTSYRDKKRTIREGRCAEWWDNGELRFEGSFQNDERHGDWLLLENGWLFKGAYRNGLREGPWAKLDSTEKVRQFGTYRAGTIEGSISYYDAQGELCKQVMYRTGDLEELLYFESSAPGALPPEEYLIYERERPAFPGCENQYRYDSEAFYECTEDLFMAFLFREIRYPLLARENGIEGMVHLRFVVTETGAIEAVEVLRAPSPLLAEECLRLIAQSPPWLPAYRRGQPVRSQHTTGIKFSLE